MTAPPRPRQLRALALALTLTAGAVAAGPAPTIDPHALFAAMRAASGGDHWRGIREIDRRSELVSAGLQGHEVSRIDIHSGRYVVRDEVGPASQSQGYDGHRAWSRDEKGLVTVLDGVRGHQDALTAAYVNRNGWFHPHTDPAQMRYLGERTDAGKRFQVVRVVPRGGTPIEVWVDPATHLLAATRMDAGNGQTQISRYTDYRQVDGVRLPFSEHVGTVAQPDQQIVHVRHVQLRHAVDHGAFAMPVSQVRDARILGGADSTTVPFRSYAGLIVVRVAIDGRKPLPFVLDSGGLNLLTPAAAAKLRLHGTGKQAVSGVGPGAASMSLATVRHYQLGQAQLDDQRFYIIQLPKIMTDRGDREPIAGLIGYEVLRRFVARIDYDRHTLTLTRPDRFSPPKAGRVLKLRFDGRTPQIAARVDGQRGLFLLDTGNAGDLDLTAHFAHDHHIALVGHVGGGLAAGVGGAVSTDSGRVGTLSLAGYTLHRPHASIVHARGGVLASSELAGNIGYRVLSRFTPTLDYPRQRMYLQPGAHFAHADTAPRATSGVGLERLDHHTLRIIAVQPHSPAQRAHLAVGTKVIAIDSIAVSHIGLDRLHRHLRGAPGSAMTLTVIEGKGHRVVHLRRELPGMH